MTYNVGNGLASARLLGELLRQEAPDVVGLQELALSQAQQLAEDMASIYPYQVLVPSGFGGKGLLSRYPVVSQEQLALYSDRQDLRALIDVGAAALTIMVAHAPPPRVRRARLQFDPIALAQLATLAGLALG